MVLVETANGAAPGIGQPPIRLTNACRDLGLRCLGGASRASAYLQYSRCLPRRGAMGLWWRFVVGRAVPRCSRSKYSSFTSHRSRATCAPGGRADLSVVSEC